MVSILGAATYFEWNRTQQLAKAETNGTALWQLLQEDDTAARAEAAAHLDLSPEAAPVVALQQAASAVETGDVESAVTALQALAANPDVGAPLQDVARLKLAAISDGVLDDAARLDLLEPMAVEGHALRPLALEQRALIRLGSDDIAGARADLSAIADDPLAPQTARVRADQVLTALGPAPDGQDG